MKTAICYASIHGKTKKIVDLFQNIPLFNVADNPDLTPYDLVIFICPTYGDEELPLIMEDFLQIIPKDKKYTICETGNYYGFEDYELGAKKIIEFELKKRNWREFFRPLSLDTLPEIDYNYLQEWKNDLYDAIQKNKN